jgi:hypothetical protein
MPFAQSFFVWGIVLALGFFDARFKPDENLVILSYVNLDYPLVGAVSFIVTYSIVLLVVRGICRTCCRRNKPTQRMHIATDMAEEHSVAKRYRAKHRQDSFVEYARIAMSEVEALFRSTGSFHFDTSRNRDKWIQYVQESFEKGYPFNPHLVARAMYG